MLYIDISYLKQIASRLDRFKEKDINHLWNCRCMFCGDSQKKKNKARGYFYVMDNTLLYKCHNCPASMSFSHFLKDFDPNLFQRYSMDLFREKFASKPIIKKEEPNFKTSTIENLLFSHITDDLKNINQLADTHPAKKYVKSRLIPEQYWDKLFYTPKYFKWSKQHSDKFTRVPDSEDHPRLVIPWYDEKGNIDAYVARSFGKEEPRYIKINISENKSKFFNLDKADFDKTVYVLEGPIDAMMIPNAVAVGSAALWNFRMSKNAIYIPDRDIRNPEVMKGVRHMIKLGLKVCLLPDGLPGKDLNEFRLAGLTEKEIIDIINENVCQGMEAMVKFEQWKKVKYHE